MRHIVTMLFSICAVVAHAQNNIIKGSGVCYFDGTPTTVINPDYHCEIGIDTATGLWWEWSRDDADWIPAGFRIQLVDDCDKPTHTPLDKYSHILLNPCDSLWRYREGDWHLISGGGSGTSITVGNADDIPFVNETEDGFEYNSNFQFRDSTLYLETLPENEGTPALHIVRNADTSSVPIRTILIENNTEITGVTGDYHNQVNIALRAGVTQPWARYLKYEKHNGVTQYLNGAGQGSFIEYDSEFNTHRKWFEYGGVSKYYSAGTGAFHINEHNAENPGTGGFIVSDGGTTASRLFQAGVNDHDVEMIADDGSTWYARFFGATKSFTLFGPGSMNINTIGHGAPAYVNFYKSDDQIAGNLLYNASGQLRWNIGGGGGEDFNYWILRYTGGGTLQDIPLQISNATGVVQIPNSSATAATTIVGRTGTGEITIMGIDDESLSIVDGVLYAIAQSGGDSTFTDTSGLICIITPEMDTLCSDSIWIDTDLNAICVIIDGDTTCTSFGAGLVTLYAGNGTLAGDRTVQHNGHYLWFRNGTSNLFQIEPKTASSEPTIRTWNKNCANCPALTLNGALNQSIDIFQHFDGVTQTGLMRDYTVGIDVSEAAFRFSKTNLFNNFFWSHYGNADSTVFHKKVTFLDPIYDHDGIKGTAGQVLVADADGRVSWDDQTGGGGAIPINDLLAADGTNDIDNENYGQVWRWDSLYAGYGLKIISSSPNTNLPSGSVIGIDGQKLLHVVLDGENNALNDDSDASSSYAGYFENTHSGIGENYGIAGVAQSGTNSYGVLGLAGTYGVLGQTNVEGGIGVFGFGSSGGVGVRGTAATSGASIGVEGLALQLSVVPIQASISNPIDGVPTAIRVRPGKGNQMDTGEGAAIDWVMSPATGSADTSAIIANIWTDATNATRTSALDFSLLNSGIMSRKLRIAGDGRMTWDGYVGGSFGGASTDSVLVINKSTGVVSYRNASAFGGGGGGDNWGTDVVNTDITLTGDGTVGDVLKVDTTIIATIAQLHQHDTVVLKYIVEAWDIDVLTGLKMRTRIAAQYDGWTLIRADAMHVEPGTTGTDGTDITIENVTQAATITSALTLAPTDIFDSVTGLSHVVDGYDLLEFEVTGEIDIPGQGLEIHLYLIR